MGTVFDYLNWRGDLTFDQAPLNEVDSMIFALLSYIDFQEFVPSEHSTTGVTIQSVANSYFAAHPDYRKESIGLLIPKEILKLLKAVKTTKRFRKVYMRAYVNEIDLKQEMQFSAVTFVLGNAGIVIAYRGTDDTIIGWKENFNMSFLPHVPAQSRAVEYLEEAASDCEDMIYLTGQSKGGNLAAYAGIHCSQSIFKRIAGIWNHDGPGFGEGALKEKNYLDRKSMIHTILPKSSLVGILLEHTENYTVVSSRQVGLLQHDALSWNVMGSKFIHLKSIGDDSRHSDRTLNSWIWDMTPQQRERFTEALYQVLSSDHALTLTDLASPKNRWMIKGMKLDPEVGKIMSKTLTALVSENTKDFIREIFGKKL